MTALDRDAAESVAREYPEMQKWTSARMHRFLVSLEGCVRPGPLRTLDRDTVLNAVVAVAPSGMELRYDGSEDPYAAAYVAGVQAAHDAAQQAIALLLLRPVEGVVLTREEAEHAADWHDYIVDQGGEVPADETEMALRIRAGAAS